MNQQLTVSDQFGLCAKCGQTTVVPVGCHSIETNVVLEDETVRRYAYDLCDECLDACLDFIKRWNPVSDEAQGGPND